MFGKNYVQCDRQKAHPQVLGIHFLLITAYLLLLQGKQQRKIWSKLVVSTGLLFCYLCSFGQVSGLVVDEHHHQEPLIGATVLLLPDSIYTSSDAKGKFAFKNIKDGAYLLRCSYIGFHTMEKEVSVVGGKADFVKIKMHTHHELLETVEIIHEHNKQEETLQAEHIDDQFIAKNIQGTFAQTIEKLPGISSINVGVGIAKPVIRGLSANRIIVNHQGVKQESQQWGNDHGLEIDQFDVERVEIIKGPGSLQYGSDGLGGVINIMPGRILPPNSFDGSLTGVYKTNNRHWGGSARFGFNLKDVFFNARYSRQDFGDYRVPASEFEYNSFTLPIYNNTLKNTAGNENNFSISTGVSRSWGVTRLTVSQYQLEAGLFSGAVGIPRSYSLSDDGNNRDIDVPKQEVTHLRATLNQSILFGEDHLVVDIGYQRNLRKEFSYPEFHSIPSSLIDPNNTLALQLELETYSISAHYEKHGEDHSRLIYGGNLQWQENIRSGFEFLLPNFKTFRSGVFIINERDVRENLLINAGFRYDFANNTTTDFTQYVWDSNENITDSLTAPITDKDFHNWSASLGANLHLFDDTWVLKANIGKSFRVPYPAETVSNGIHHGTFRHEVGNPDLSSEQGYQFDIGAIMDYHKFSANVAFYFNYFADYIYLGPSFPARFSPLPEAGQIFLYRQDDAIYTGGEIQWDWQVLPQLTWNQSLDYVQSYNVNTKLALPFTPQPSIKNDLVWTFKDKAFLRNFQIELKHEYHLAAQGRLRVDRSEQSTPAYQLWGVGSSWTLQWGKQAFDFNFQIQNLFDTQYLAHLSRYRVINVPEQGRNFVFSLKVPFAGNFPTKNKM